MLHDITTSEEVIGAPGLPWWAWLGIFIFMSLLALLIRTLLKFRSTKPKLPIKNLADALTELAELKTQDLSTTQQATEVSLLMRRFLMIHFEDPALYETHEEYLQRGEGLENLPQKSRQQLADYLTTLAEQKYGSQKTSILTADALFDQTESLMRTLDASIPKTLPK